jgi:Zn-dependent protease
MDLAITLVILILSVIAHEVAHGYAAYALGDPTAKLAGRLTLNPLAHIDLVGSVLVPLLLVLSGSGVLFGWAKPVPYNPYNLRNQRWGEALVAIAGVATNLLLAVIFAFFVRAAAEGLIPASAGAFAATVVLVNLFLGLFNLIPFPPLDGFTFLRGILPYRFSYSLHQFENRIRSLGALGLLLVLFLFSAVLVQPFFVFVSIAYHALTGA